jgi:hypothetical protein
MADTNQTHGSKKRKTRESSESDQPEAQEPEKHEQPEEDEPEPKVECPVCYTDGTSSGIVKPACCDHTICLACYTNIVVRQPTDPVCPCCRAHYLAQDQIIEASSPMYSNQIHEGHLVYLDHLILSSILGLPPPNLRVVRRTPPANPLPPPQTEYPPSDTTDDTEEAPNS